MAADFLDEEDLEKKVLPYIIKHSTQPDRNDDAAPASDRQEELEKKEMGTPPPSAPVPASQCYDSDHKEDDAAWFQLFDLLQKYCQPGALERAFALVEDGDDV